MHVAILLAGGQGRRTQGRWADKVQAPLGGRAVFAWSLQAFARSHVVDAAVVVTRDAQQAEALAVLAQESTVLPVTFATGGAERQDSVLNGLDAAPAGTTSVFIHDAARPLVLPGDIARLADHLNQTGRSVCLAHRVTDTIKRTPAIESQGGLLEDLDRRRLWAMETPQAFPYPLIHKAYRQITQTGASVTDDADAAVRAGHEVDLMESSAPNPKLTRAEDLAWLEFLLQNEPAFASLRF